MQPSFYWHGYDAVSASSGHGNSLQNVHSSYSVTLCCIKGPSYRATGKGVYPICAFQQRKRAEVAGIQRENGFGKRVELPYFIVERA